MESYRNNDLSPKADLFVGSREYFLLLALVMWLVRDSHDIDSPTPRGRLHIIQGASNCDRKQN